MSTQNPNNQLSTNQETYYSTMLPETSLNIPMPIFSNSLNLIFTDGIDWNAFLTSFNSLQTEEGYEDLSIKAIEQKDDGKFIVRVHVPANIKKGELDKRFFNQYQQALEEINNQYRQKLQAKDKDIELYHQQSADILALARLQGATFGGGVAGRDNTGDVNNDCLDNTLHETVKEIQTLINQLSQDTQINHTSEQMKIAAQVIEKIETTPTWKEKAIQASQQGLLEAMKSNPIGAFVAGAIEGWKQPSH